MPFSALILRCDRRSLCYPALPGAVAIPRPRWRGLIRNALFAAGLNVTRQTDPADLLQFVERLFPQSCGKELIRIGGDGDGGYLIPDDLGGIEYCFSPGVSNKCSFEEHLANLGIRSFLADYSVTAPPLARPEFTFDKKFLRRDQ